MLQLNIKEKKVGEIDDGSPKSHPTEESKNLGTMMTNWTQNYLKLL